MLLRKELSVAVIAFFLAVLTSAERIKRMYALCPPNFIRIGSECYFISTERVNWLDAHFECKDRNSRLAEPIKHEDRTLRKFLVHGEEPERFDIWIGGIYNWERKKWQWGYNGRDIAYQSFSQMAPGSSQDLRFHCAVLNPQLKYRWSARSCVDKHHYICQHRMPYVTEKNREKIYTKWNETYPNQMANEVEVVLSEEDRIRNQQRRHEVRLQRNRQRNMKQRNQNPKGVIGAEDRQTNSVDWPQQPQQPRRNNNRRQRPNKNNRKHLNNNILTEVDNSIGDLNSNRVPDNGFSPDGGYGMRPGHRNRTRNPKNPNSDLFGPRRRKHKKTTTATTTTTTTSTTPSTTTSTTEEAIVTHAPSTTPRAVIPLIRYSDREPTSAEERNRIENEQIRRQEEVRRRGEQEERRQREENEIREKNRQDMEIRRAQIEERKRMELEQERRREEKREQEALLRQQEERKQLQWDQDQRKREEEIRERNSNSVERQLEQQSVTSQRPRPDEETEEARQPIQDPRVESRRKAEEEKRRKRDKLRKRLQQLSPEGLKEFYAKRAERNKRREDAATKRESEVTGTLDQ